MNNPLGIDAACPRFCWQLQSQMRNVHQAAYQIQVSKDTSFNELLWDSSRINTDQSLFVEYAGPELSSRCRYYFKVRVWDNFGNDSGWSGTHWWEMGLLSPNDWKANWLTHPYKEKRKEFKPVYYFRKVFSVEKDVKQVRIYASALGLYEIHLNGNRLGDDLFTPGLTEYKHHIQYQTYEANLKESLNAIGITLGEGWYRGRFQIKGRNTWGKIGAIILQMHIEYKDGSQEMIITDPSWKVSTGPILRSDIYDGEDYDARLENDWCSPEFDDRSWASTKKYHGYSRSKLVAPLGEKVRRIESISAKKTITTPSGEIVLDFGQNLTGWVRLIVDGESGQQITVDFAEILDKDGNFYRDNYRTARSQINYICKGEGQETYEPHFTYFGFRFARIRGYDKVNLTTLTAIVIHSDLKPTGKFFCSNPLVNQLQENILWGEKGNFLDIPTDCPQRDERLGYTGDAQIFARTAAFNMDVYRFFRKWLKDLAISHAFNGAVPFWIPSSLRLPFATSGWGDAAIIVPWKIYLVYGDKRILLDQYESMKKWLGYEKLGAGWPKFADFLHPLRWLKYDRFIWDRGFHLGDWLAPGEGRKEWMAKKPWIATAYYAHSAQLLSKIAKIIGNVSDAARFQKLFKHIREAFCKRFVTEEGSIRNGFQTAYALALEFDLLPDTLRMKSASYLAEDIHFHDDHLTTGFLGTPHLNFALSNNHQTETAYCLLLQETCPSWLYPVKMGATTIWERWDGIQPDGTTNESKVGSDNMVSFNHYAFGAIGDWLYRVVAGIDLDPEHTAYKHIMIQPKIGGDLDYAEARFESPYGLVRSSWKRIDHSVSLIVNIPPNTTAQITLPDSAVDSISTTDGLMKECNDYRHIRHQSGNTVLEVGSGEYLFTWRME